MEISSAYSYSPGTSVVYSPDITTPNISSLQCASCKYHRPFKYPSFLIAALRAAQWRVQQAKCHTLIVLFSNFSSGGQFTAALFPYRTKSGIRISRANESQKLRRGAEWPNRNYCQRTSASRVACLIWAGCCKLKPGRNVDTGAVYAWVGTIFSTL